MSVLEGGDGRSRGRGGAVGCSSGVLWLKMDGDEMGAAAGSSRTDCLEERWMLFWWGVES